ncbi:MAG: class I SAM-dependent methyltransferase [bacterium]
MDLKSVRMEIAKLFDLIGDEFVPDAVSMEQFIATFFEKTEIRDKVILDAGCGTGIATVCFGKKQAKQSLGIDISYDCLRKGMELRNGHNLTNVNYQLGDITNLPFCDNSFDLVSSVGVFPYINGRNKVTDEFRRILKRQGRLLIMSLRKQKIDILYEWFRKILSNLPSRYHLLFARVMAFVIQPMSKIFLGRNILHGEKPISQTILESFFVPQKLFKDSPEELKNLLEKKGFRIEVLNPPTLSFCSPKTVFVLKGKLL